MSDFESVQKPGTCDHCGRDLASVSYGRTVEGKHLCHPMIPDGPDCYRLVTVYHEPVGKRMAPLSMRTPTDDEVAELKQRLADAIPTELTATPHVGVGSARRLKIALAVLPVMQDEISELKSKLEEMTRMRDSALRQLNRADDEAPFELEELIFQGIDAVISDWEGDVPLSRVVESIARMLHPEVVKLTEYQERAEAKIRGLAKERLNLLDQISTTKAHYQHRTETLEAARDRSKKRLDDVVNEVFTITDAYSLPEDRDEAGNAHLYGLGRLAALKDAYFAVLRGLGVFEPNHTVHEGLGSLNELLDSLEERLEAIEALTEHAKDTKLLRLAINDPGAFTQRQKINEEEMESLGNWAARAIQVALREGRGDR